MNMIEEILDKKTQKTQPAILNKILSTAKKPGFTPSRFSVRGLRKHAGIQTSRNPIVFG